MNIILKKIRSVFACQKTPLSKYHELTSQKLESIRDRASKDILILSLIPVIAIGALIALNLFLDKEVDFILYWAVIFPPHIALIEQAIRKRRKAKATGARSGFTEASQRQG